MHTLGNFMCGGQGPDAAGGLVGYKTALRQVSLNVQTTELSSSTAGFWKAGTTSVSSFSRRTEVTTFGKGFRNIVSQREKVHSDSVNWG